MRAFFMPDTLW